MPGVGKMPKPKADVVLNIMNLASYFYSLCQVFRKIIAARRRFVQPLKEQYRTQIYPKYSETFFTPPEKFPWMKNEKSYQHYLKTNGTKVQPPKN
jgi:aminopeptidase C